MEPGKCLFLEVIIQRQCTRQRTQCQETEDSQERHAAKSADKQELFANGR
jgi:hypothetical protein